jgi:hypothetical protein
MARQAGSPTTSWSEPERVRFRIGYTDGQGASLRREPSTDSERVRALAEGTEVFGYEHAWRQVTDAAGDQG